MVEIKTRIDVALKESKETFIKEAIKEELEAKEEGIAMKPIQPKI